MMLLVLTLLIFATTLGLALSFLYFFVETPIARRKMRTRLAAVQELAFANPQAPDLLRKQLLSDIEFYNRVLASLPGIAQLRLFLEQAGVRMQVGTFMLIVFSLPLFVFTGMLTLGLQTLQCFIAAAGAAAIPFAITAGIRRRRFNKFEEQFPEAMDLLGRAVRAGHAFTTGFELIGTEMPDPVGEEFRIAFQQQNLGLPLRDALTNVAVRVPLADVRIFVSAIQIQRDSGGNLGEILDTLSMVMRERFKLQRQVKTFTAEGRLSSYALTTMPLVGLLGMYVFNPNYLMPLFRDPSGQKALAVVGVLQIVGHIVISRIIKIKV
jgi:tight adherence protein B